MSIDDHQIPVNQVREIIDALPESLSITGHLESRVITIDGEELRPLTAQKTINTIGFAWGYAGSGPALLALAILLKYLPEDIAYTLYQQFKINVVSGWPQGSFGLRINLKEEIEKILMEE